MADSSWKSWRSYFREGKLFWGFSTRTSVAYGSEASQKPWFWHKKKKIKCFPLTPLPSTACIHLKCQIRLILILLYYRWPHGSLYLNQMFFVWLIWMKLCYLNEIYAFVRVTNVHRFLFFSFLKKPCNSYRNRTAQFIYSTSLLL